MENLLQHEIGLLAKDLRKYLLENYLPEDKLHFSPENGAYLRTSSQAKDSTPLPAPPAAAQSVPAPSLPKTTAPPTYTPTAVTPKRKPLPFTQNEAAPASPKEERREIRLAATQEKTHTSDHNEMLQNIRTLFPDMRVVEPPKPDLAPIIAILKQGESGAELRFLYHIAEAIQSCFNIPCKVIARTNNAFDPAITKLMIAAEHRLSTPLPNIPLLPLPDLSLHMQNPSLKASLWSTICQNVRKYVHR
ncbi:MAG: hypothetical protein WC222_02575 [Parachlamydiales bacterium]|jgi:hypothetical protein